MALIVVDCHTALFNLLPVKGLDGRKAWIIVVIALAYLRSRSRQGYADWSRPYREQKAIRLSKAMAGDLVTPVKDK